MPMLFLSPSTQEYNMYYDGSGSEEYYMNLIADMMEPYLSASGITYGRNNPAGTVASCHPFQCLRQRELRRSDRERRLLLPHERKRSARGGNHRKKSENHLPAAGKGARRRHDTAL